MMAKAYWITFFQFLVSWASLPMVLPQFDGPEPALLEANPSFIRFDRTNVTVSWSGIPSPTVSDWIGVYTPIFGKHDLIFRTPVKLKMCSESTTHIKKGHGSLSFSLLNMRDDYVFALFRSGVELAQKPKYSGPYAEPLTLSKVVKLSEELKDMPSGIHLALTDKVSEMVVMWTTKTIGYPVVEYDLTSSFESSGQLHMRQKGISTTYNATDMCPDGPADSSGFINPGMIHRVILTSLQPHTSYSYRVGDFSRRNAPSSFSAIFSFTSGGADSNGEVRIILMADMGTSEAEHDGSVNGGHPRGDNVMTLPIARAIYEQVTFNRPIGVQPHFNDTTSCDPYHFEPPSPWWCSKPTLIIHYGDLNYALGQSADWEEWMQQIMPYTTKAPLMVSLGNHERNWRHKNAPTDYEWPIPGLFDWGSINATASGGECGIPVETRFSMPGWPWGTHKPGVWGSVDRKLGVYNDEPWYGFRHGPIYFYMMSSEHDLAPGSPQFKHMDRTLSGVNRTQTPWLVVTAHRSMYVSSIEQDIPDGDQPIANWMRKSIEILYEKYNVDVGFYGHFHAYQRSCRVMRGTCVGASSNQSAQAPIHIVMGTGGTQLDVKSEQIPAPPFTEYTNTDHWGYGRLWANMTALNFEFVDVENGKVVDSLWLKK